ncbi:MAG TPA: RNase H family protein [Allosphingosinicella sp.]|jgi:ribonuclease HI
MGGLAGARRLKVYFDGGCRPNPGRIEVAVVVRGVTHLFDDLGSGTSEDAEWLALRTALRIAQASGESEFDLLGDSAHVIAQATDAAKGRGQAALDHRAAFGEEAALAPPRRIRWIQRSQNLAGIALARRRGLP